MRANLSSLIGDVKTGAGDIKNVVGEITNDMGPVSYTHLYIDP